MDQIAVSAEGVSFRYGDVEALRKVTFRVEAGSIYALLGPNGGGKTTLFRILCTLLKPDAGVAQIFGADVVENPQAVRRLFGVVFQSQSLDRRLSAEENLVHQGHLYGLRGAVLRKRCSELLSLAGMASEAQRRVEQMSGGQRRRVELAKALLHDPPLLLLDEPSTGVDPGGRKDFWSYLERLRADRGVTILLTTHLLDEAESCDRIAILDRGNLVAEGSPAILKRLVGGDVVSFTCREPEAFVEKLRAERGIRAEVIDGEVRFEQENAMEVLGRLAGSYASEIESARVSRPSLEDVFVYVTGHRLEESKPASLER